MRICPRCENDVELDLKICPYCSFRFKVKETVTTTNKKITSKESGHPRGGIIPRDRGSLDDILKKNIGK